MMPHRNVEIALDLLGIHDGCPRCGSKKRKKIKTRGYGEGIYLIYSNFICSRCGLKY